jgi:hypothetical protein
MSRAQPPACVTIAISFMLVLGVVWVLIGLIVASGAHPAMHIPPPWSLLMAGLLIATGLIAFGLAVALGRRSRFGFYAALVFLAASALAVVFDQVGWIDLMVVAANVIPVILLLKARLWYLGA